MKSLQKYFKNIKLPEPNSHKGQNGKLLIIGGSELFHAASKWSLDTASKFVDMVFYCSIPSNNELIQHAKQNFWNGIVITRDQIEDYIQEADCILIGPGMTREKETATLTDMLLTTYPTKKWVIDAGALQMVDPKLLTQNMIITPHHNEIKVVLDRLEAHFSEAEAMKTSKQLGGVTVVLKGATDLVFTSEELIEVQGGNAGMTKGGTGDVLAGLIAALYCTNDALTSAVVGSYINKKAGEELAKEVGPFFNASDLVQQVPKTLWQEITRK